MISFICCSINPKMAAELKNNIAETTSVPYELIFFDNREAKNGICKVYNDCAKKAKYDYLCFLHEDILFKTRNWDQRIIEKLSEEDCGAIGFAGSIAKYKLPSGWGAAAESARVNVIQHHPNGDVTTDVANPNNEDFARVITLDGLCIFVRRNVWEEIKFDEETFEHFHCYDLDFALSVAQKYKNYVCYTTQTEHKSLGSYNYQWQLATKKLHDKWKGHLPMHTPEWIEYTRTNDTKNKIEYSITRYTMKNFAEIVPPIDSAKVYFTRYWRTSHRAWLIMFKCLVTDKIKRK